MARVLITGGAGLIGSNLGERLAKEGDEIVILDDFSTGSEANLDPILRRGRVEVVRSNVAHPIDIDSVDAIYHLACPASPVHYQRDAVRTIDTAVQGTRAVLDLAASCRAPVLIASTSEVYGDPQVHPQPETYWGNVNPFGPRACYDEGKRCGEALAAAYATQRGVDARIVRIFNTYGPRMRADDGRVISNFVVQALEGEPLTIYGDGTQTRSFCYVGDLVDGLIRVIDGPADLGPINLGNPDERSVIDVARLVLSLTGSRSRIERRPLPTDDPTRRRPDTTRAEERLGWRPVVALEEGLGPTIEDFRRRLRAEPEREVVGSRALGGTRAATK